MTVRMRPAAGAYTEATKAAAEANQDFVMGYISQTPNAWPGGPGSPGKPFCLIFLAPALLFVHGQERFVCAHRRLCPLMAGRPAS